MEEGKDESEALYLALQMMSLKIIDLSQRLTKFGNQDEVDLKWSEKMTQLFKTIYKKESTNKYFCKALVPLIKFF